MINCCVIDDEQSAIDVIKIYIEKTPELNLLETFRNPFKGLTFIQENTVDVVFLDVDMENLNGLELMRMCDAKIVLMTAHEEYATRSFNHPNTIDYLLKPVLFERFCLAVKRIKDTYSPKQVIEAIKHEILIKTIKGYQYIEYKNISYIQAKRNYCQINFHGNPPLMSMSSIGELEMLLPRSFIRNHRSYIINKDQVIGSESTAVILVGGVVLPLSRTYRQNL